MPFEGYKVKVDAKWIEHVTCFILSILLREHISSVSII